MRFYTEDGNWDLVGARKLAAFNAADRELAKSLSVAKEA